MKAVMLYHQNSEEQGVAENYAHEFERFKSKSITMLSLETKEGDDMAKLYDVGNYPAIVVTAEDGRLIKLWQGQPLPLMDELSFTIGESSDIKLQEHKKTGLA